MGSDTLAAVDRDVLSRFATCCRALGLSVHDKARPAAALLTALDPRPVDRLQADAVPLPGDLLARVAWQVEATKSPLFEQTRL